MPACARNVVLTLVAAVVAISAGCGAAVAPGALMARAPDDMHVAVATAGTRNVRVLYLSGASIVRLREVFVPEGEAIVSIAWSNDGRAVIVTTRGPTFAVDTRTWRVEAGAERGREVASGALRHG